MRWARGCTRSRVRRRASCGRSGGGFGSWKVAFAREAAAKGIGATGLAALAGTSYATKTIWADRNQKSFKLSLSQFMVKRGGQAERQDLDAAELAAPSPDDQLLAVHDALDDLEQLDPDAAKLVKLRFFAGMTMTEAADALDVSVRKAHEVWAYARAWLHRQLRPE